MNNFFILNDNNKLSILTHKLNNPKVILIHLHGLHGHFQFIYDCYDSFIKRVDVLKKANILSYALEFRGHGKSSGKKGYFKNFDELVSDIKRLLEYIEHLHPNIPIYILGESMGGAIAVKVSIILDNISGIVLLAPMLQVSKKIKPKEFLINILISIANKLPNITINSKKKYKKYKFEIYDKEYQNSLYTIKNKLTLGIMKECYDMCKWINENKKKFNLPLLIIHSYSDNITCVDTSLNFYNNCSSEDKEILLLQDSEHCLLVPNSKEDCIPQTIILKIVNWINNRLD